MSQPVKRAYDASRRHAHAAATRRAALDAARPLFVTGGYEGTSMLQIAEAAGVSPQTLYNGFGSKAELLIALVDVVIAGDDEPVAVADRPAARAMASMDDPSALVRAAVTAATSILERFEELHDVLAAASASEPLVAAANERGQSGRRSDLRPIARRLGELGALRRGITVERATDIVWAVLSPEMHHLLVGVRGWSRRDYERWAVATLEASLLGS